jgi:hypothetical protein
MPGLEVVVDTAVAVTAATKPDRPVATFQVATPVDTRHGILTRVEVVVTAAIGAAVADTATVRASIWVTHTMAIIAAAIIATGGAFADTDLLMELV